MNHVIELPINEMKTALTGLSKVISKRSTLPVLEHVRVTRDREGVVTLQATDLDATAIYQGEQRNVGSPCDFLVPFEPLNKLVKGSKEPVLLISEGKDKVRLKTSVGTSPMEQALDSLPVDEFPPTVRVEGTPILVNEHFCDCLRQALECCSDEGSRHVIQHVCLDTRPAEGHYIAASDGRHLFAANSFHFDLKEPVLIRNQAFLRWNKFLEDGNGELNVKPGTKKSGPWVQLKSGRWTFIGKACEDEFPKWKQVVPASNSKRTRIEFSPGAVATLLAGVPNLPGHDDSNRPVKLEVLGGTLLVKAKARDAKEWTRLTIDGATITGKATTVSLNRDYLLKALR
ncbi:MAG: hypothetical protein EB034_16695, partial [Verrucomicrobia bacterium]|nr:hypothetical protein [Verrucomicrobiota bacterium]